MKIWHLLPQRKTVFLSFIAIFVISACDNKPFKLENDMSTLPRLQTMFNATKTICFGRFLVDVPSTASVVFGPSDAEYPIARLMGARRKFDQIIDERIADSIKDRLRLDADDMLSLTKFGKIVDGERIGQKIVFGSDDGLFYQIYSYIPIDDDIYIQEAQADPSDTTLARADEATVDQSIARLNKIGKRLRARNESEAPDEAGFCIEGGFIASDELKFERIALGVRLAEFPDVHFSILATKKDRLVPSDELEPRLRQAEKEGGVWFSAVKFFRRSERQIGGWKGFEVLARRPGQGESISAHEFAFLSQGKPRDALHPVLDVTMHSGVAANQTSKTKPSITDEEAVALWDRLTASIRIRSVTKTAPHISEMRIDFPLGYLVPTGKACPQEGYWANSTSDAETPRLFPRGEIMPQCSMKRKVSLIGRIRGELGINWVDTTWILVRYPDVANVFVAPLDEGNGGPNSTS